jgi:hypothetical protein
MTCDREVRLVEKLADGEASPRERARAEAHMESCEDCRSHYQFVRALETASEHIEWSAPPEAYWQHLPAKVLARIRSGSGEERSPWRRRTTPAVLRFGAVAATVTVVVAVGLVVMRDAPDQLEPQMAPAPMNERQAELQADASESPETVADAPASSGTAAEAPEEAPPPAPVQQAPRAPAPAEPPAAAPSARARPAPVDPNAERGWEAENLERNVPPPARENRAQRSLAEAPGEAGRQREADAGEAFREEATLASDAVLRKEASTLSARTSAATGGCEQWREYLARNGDDGSESTEARYRVALCSIEEHEADPSEQSLEAVERDVEAFFALESEGERADELRARMEELERAPSEGRR